MADGNAAMKTVLVVEDEAMIRMVLVDHLEEAGYEVREAATADEAVALLGELQAIDAVVTDVRMPGSIDGIGLAGWLRQHRTTTPVIVTSGHVTMAEAHAANPNVRIISKPYELTELSAILRVVLGQGTTADVDVTRGQTDQSAHVNEQPVARDEARKGSHVTSWANDVLPGANERKPGDVERRP